MIWVKQQEPNEPIFFILFQYYISLQDDQKKKQVGLIVLKLAYLTEGDDKTFTITTPRDRLTLQVTHETAKEEWMSILKKCMSTEEKRITQEEKPEHPLPPATPVPVPVPYKPYKIKRLTNKVSLVILGKENLKPIKLKNEGPWRIGRSRDNEIIINEEECHVSRMHCEIEVIDNSAWLKDLGSAAGTFLNGDIVTKAPLKPGDTIKIGNLSLRFEVKNTKLLPVLYR